MPQGAPQTQPVKTRQNACYRIAKSVKKGRRNALDGGWSLSFHQPNFYPNARCSATLVAAKAALSLCVKTTPLPAGKLTQINPSGGKSKWNHTESHHFFHQARLELIHRYANPFIQQLALRLVHHSF
jgi:hypothetical protein